MSAAGLADWLERLESLHPAEIELGLERVAEVAARLDCLHMPCPVITVAGTNGKGSTVSALECLARASGLAVGSYTSPHILRYNERVRLDGEAVSDELLIDAFVRVEAARQAVSLTYFEFGTLAALVIFKDLAPDLVILEVGLGGRLDAVNIVDPDVAVITSISVDHEAWLGSDREVIALEKAGILRPGVPAVIAEEAPPRSLLARVAELECPLRSYDPALASRFANLPLRADNLAAAWSAADLLGFAPDPDSARERLETLVVPGRLQTLEVDGRRLVVDVSHNPAAVENLVKWLDTNIPGPCYALFAVLSDKDIHAIIRSCRERFSGWFLTELPGVGRAMPAAKVARVLEEYRCASVQLCSDPAAALATALAETSSTDTLVVFGSFYTVGGVLSSLGDERSKA